MPAPSGGSPLVASLVAERNASRTERSSHPEKKHRCGCSTTRIGNRAATLHFGRHRDKPGVGYTCSLQAMNCVSRASPDLHPSATRAAKHMQPPIPTSQGHEGGPGEIIFFDFPRRLCAAFDARKRLTTASWINFEETIYSTMQQIPVCHTIKEKAASNTISIAYCLFEE